MGKSTKWFFFHISLITILFAPLSPAHAAVADGVGIVTSGLVFDFDAANPNGGSGNNLTNLVTSNSGVSGTLQGGVTRGTANGNTFIFDGSSTSFATTTIGSTNFSSGFSLSFYAKFVSGAANDRTFERIIDFATSAATTGDANGSMWVGRYVDTNDLSVEVWNGTTRPGNCRAINAIQTGVFAHYVVTVNGGTCTFYVNKVAQTTTYIAGSFINPPAVTRNSAFIGKSNWADDYFKGEIGEIAMYNTVLSQSDVNHNYDAQTDITAPTLSNTAATVPENQSSALTVNSNQSGTWSIIGGLDSNKFNINSTTGALTFKSSPNFEVPTDSNLNNIYEVTVRQIDINGNYSDVAVAITISNVAEFASITTPALNGAPQKGVGMTISVTPSAGSTAGNLTFYIDGRRIPGCIRMNFSGSGNAICNWKPLITGKREISVTFTPNGSEYAPATSRQTFQIARRTGARGSVVIDLANA